MEIGKRISTLRNEKGLTQKDLAEKLNVTPQAVSRWENDNVEPGLDTLKEMASIFDISVDQIMDPDYAPPENKPVEAKKEERLVGTCGFCGRAIYSDEQAYKGKKKERHGRRHTYHDCMLCEECYQKEEKLKEKNRLQKIEEGKKRFTISMVLGILIGIVVALIFVGMGVGSTEEYGYVYYILSPVAGFIAFETMFTLKMDNTFVSDMFLSVADFGFVRFPGIIFTADLGGIAFLIIFKIIFAILGFVFMLLATMVALMLSAVFSTFMFFVSYSRREKGNKEV